CHWRCARRHLLSFPTRRSSDLLLEGVSDPFLGGVADGGLAVAPPQQQVARALDRVLELEARDQVAEAPLRDHAQDLAQPLQVLRSEEHTSELQSRENLVCRLLL